MAAEAASRDTNGILHLILQPGRDGSVMPEHEFRNCFCLLVAAGNDTTRYSIAAAIQALCHRPDLLAQLRAAQVWGTMADLAEKAVTGSPVVLGFGIARLSWRAGPLVSSPRMPR